jgi:hypothetical protein
MQMKWALVLYQNQANLSLFLVHWLRNALSFPPISVLINVLEPNFPFWPGENRPYIFISYHFIFRDARRQIFLKTRASFSLQDDQMITSIEAGWGI